MKLLQINSVSYGSTGNIMRSIDSFARKKGIDSYIAFPNGRHNQLKKDENHIYIGGRLSEDLHLLLDRFTGLNGCFSKLSTKRFLKEVDKLKPDLIHLHNLHNCYINIGMLFDYIKKHDIQTVWTLHDCWSMTGHCPHFMYPKCEKWKTRCYNCEKHKEYPSSYIDTSKLLYKKKKEWFTGVSKMTIVTPSNWLAEIEKASFLKEYETKVIYNGIETTVFKPVKSSFKKEYHLEDYKIILCVADDWDVKSKGLAEIYALSEILPEKYKFVLVGTVSKKKMQTDRIILLNHVEREKLIDIYSSADVLFNPTREEVFGLVNVEAMGCGTPVVVRKTGGCPEIVDDSCGYVYDTENIQEVMNILTEIIDRKSKMSEACMKRAHDFDKDKMIQKYIDLYLEKCNG